MRLPRAALLLSAVLAVAVRSDAGVTYTLPTDLPSDLKHVEGKYHLLVYDVTDPEAAEAMARMEAMVREYLGRTRDFAGRIQGKMPFLLFRKEEDYHNAGGLENTAGVFTGQCLMAFSKKQVSAQTWHVIQHEGFHQFAANVIGGDLPIWVNEGMAEYFGEGVYCGDGFVTGGIPAYRLKRIQEEIQNKQFKPIDELMKMSHAEWNRQMSEENYDQAWAMVQFLAHGDGGKYQPAFTRFMISLSHRRPWQAAWDDAFGSTEGFEKAWLDWWQKQPLDATPEVYAQAATRMLAAYAARAAGQKQTFADVDALIAAVKDHSAKCLPVDALPPGLAVDCVGLAGAVQKIGCTFAFELPAKGVVKTPMAITCTLPDKTVIRVTTPTQGVHPGQPQWTVKAPKTATTRKK